MARVKKWYVNDNSVSWKVNGSDVVAVCDSHNTALEIAASHNITAKPPMVRFKLHKDTEWDEWQVVVRINGKTNEAKTYHASDKDDAIATRHAMMEELEEHPERYQE